jgi:hypothetical protein
MAAGATVAAQLEAMAAEFFGWRASASKPISADDVPRCERPAGFAPDWSSVALEQMQRQYGEYRRRLQGILRACDSSPVKWNRADQVDAAVLLAHFERLRVELTVLRAPWRNADFYIMQSLGAVHELLVRGIDWLLDGRRLAELLVRLQNVPCVLGAGEANLASGEAEGEFASIAVQNLEGRDSCCRRTVDAVLLASAAGSLGPMRQQLVEAAAAADAAVVRYRCWLQTALPSMRTGHAAIGRAGFEDFLQNVALVEWYSVDAMQQVGELELRRSQAMSAMEEARARGTPPRPPLLTIGTQDAKIREREAQIRSFVEARGILSVPDWIEGCRLRPIPPHLEPLFGLFSDNGK